MTPLSIACSEGNPESVTALIELDARLDYVDKDEKSVLFHAAEQNNAEVIEVKNFDVLVDSPEVAYDSGKDSIVDWLKISANVSREAGIAKLKLN